MEVSMSKVSKPKASRLAFFSLGVAIVFAAASSIAFKASGSPVSFADGQSVCLQDSATQNFITWNEETGAYTLCASSDGFALSGTGKVKLVNGVQTLTDFQPDRRISAGFLTGQLTGKATAAVRQAPGVWQTVSINDTNPVPPASCTCSIPSGGSDTSLMVFLALVVGWLGWKGIRRFAAHRPNSASA